MMFDDVVKSAPTATEIADRVMQAIEKSAGVVGSQVERLWPQMVQARWGEALATLVLLTLATVIAWSLIYRGRAGIGKCLKRAAKAADDGDEGGMIVMIVLGVSAVVATAVLWGSVGIPSFAALVAPEGQYVREIVKDALK